MKMSLPPAQVRLYACVGSGSKSTVCENRPVEYTFPESLTATEKTKSYPNPPMLLAHWYAGAWEKELKIKNEELRIRRGRNFFMNELIVFDSNLFGEVSSTIQLVSEIKSTFRHLH